VICRLEGDRVPFRSVARHLIRGLSDAAREPFHLEVLRPPTFEQLAKRLRAAKAQCEPFHVVHFDGHGLSGEVFFENPELKQNAQSVKAAELGKLLHEARVPLLILNACRSADSEPPEQPKQAGDVHQQIRQFGSFAHAVMDCGASGVVAWRYSVFVDTAAQYMADLYGALASGLPLGEAATLARKQLSSAANTPIEDWTVPVVFEAASVQLFHKAEGKFEIKLEARPAAESGLPQAPDVASSAAMKPSSSWTGRSMSRTSSCCTPTREAARPARQRSSPVGTGRPAAWPGLCCSARSNSISRCRGCSTSWAVCSKASSRRTEFNG
jgi:hypothetical protein